VRSLLRDGGFHRSEKEKPIMLKAPKVIGLSLATAGAALGAACSSSGGSSASGTIPPATGNAVSAQSTSLGTILVDGKGRTVYVFANDKTNTSTCVGACAADWPAVPAPAPLPTSLPGVTGAISMTTRSDGGHQLTVAGHPVYTFSGDSAPGQTKGQGITLNGGLWTVVSPSGVPDANPTPAGGATSAPGPTY
jgi:predicted lipoprotein with Yx(FWY)xxD motif